LLYRAPPLTDPSTQYLVPELGNCLKPIKGQFIPAHLRRGLRV
jgi:hypothetical protein